MTTTKARQVTQTIAGHEITLTKGRRYLASRPMASRWFNVYPVSITDITGGVKLDAIPETEVNGLSYDQANELLAAFNDGKSSFAGRVWK